MSRYYRSFLEESTVSTPLLLDTYSGASVAYSLRKLSSTYTGSAIRVRRSSDNTEQNIGFDGTGNLDTAALLTFVGAGNGFVTTWYDQSGNSLNVTQSTATQQPNIVNSGIIITSTGLGASKPSILFKTGYLSRSFLSFSDYTLFNVKKLRAGGNNGIAMQNGTATGFGLNTNNGGQYSLYERGVADHFFGLTSYNLVTISGVRVQSSNILNGYVNNNKYTMSPSTIVSPSGIFYVGSGDGGGSIIDGNQSELILYSTNQTTNVSNINTNINNYYAIY